MKLHDCVNCSRPILKKSYESSNRYSSRKFCSQECSKTYMRKNRIGWFAGERKKYTEKFVDIDFPPMPSRNIVY